MEDQYVVLLERVVAENVRLREAMEARDNEQRRMFEELASKIESSNTEPERSGRSSRKRRRKISVPQQCRQDVRKMYKALSQNEDFDGFKLDESFLAEANQTATKTIIEAVIADRGGTENCPWSPAEIKGAAATYLKSLYDAAMRAKKGKLEAHKDLCRRQGRMRDKTQKRLVTLKTMPWSNEKKAQVEEAVGSLAYTSSDESDFSEDESGQSKLSRYLVKRLPWERTSLTKAKRELNEAYSRSLESKRVHLVTRRPHPMPSTRRRPTEPLEWPVRAENPAPTPGTRPSSSTCTRTPSHPTPAVIPPTSTRPPSSGTPPTRTRPPSSGTPPTRTHPPSSGTQPTRTCPPSSGTPPNSTHPPSSGTPPSRTRPPTTGSPPTRPSPSSCPARTTTPSPSTSSARLPATVTPSPSTLSSRSGTSSLLPDCSSTPKTSKPKKTLKSKKDVAHRRSASPAY
ncbi:uncharacterized protein [Porites lutea]|uniref:uncharacterized protein n=1 Tax=Porites lutea TaxID=51062 RepID=UPI003CC5E6B7